MTCPKRASLNFSWNPARLYLFHRDDVSSPSFNRAVVLIASRMGKHHNRHCHIALTATDTSPDSLDRRRHVAFVCGSQLF